MSQCADEATKKNRTKVEETIMDQLDKIRDANKLKDYNETYDHIINNWYLFDAHWLSFVCHMKNTGRLQ